MTPARVLMQPANDFIKVTLPDGAVSIDTRVFELLLDQGMTSDYKAYKGAVQEGKISFKELKLLAEKTDVPYPLLFAPYDKVCEQKDDMDAYVLKRLPDKDEIRVTSRGLLAVRDIEPIAKDLSRKQEFLKNRLLPDTCKNEFVGIIAKEAKEKVSIVILAEVIRKYLEINLTELRARSKSRVLQYIVEKIEAKNVFVSFSSYNFMPQRLNKKLGMSGICIKDKKFPFIFINTRDGDENPMILETDGRQIFTLTSMLVCIAMGKFILNLRNGKAKEGFSKKVYSIAGEVLIPASDLQGIVINSLLNLKDEAKGFKVTPSMLLVRLRELGLISADQAKDFKDQLKREIENIEKRTPRPPTQVNGYAKYNGQRLSYEVIRGEKSGKINADDVKRLLFRKGTRMDSTVLNEYRNKFK